MGIFHRRALRFLPLYGIICLGGQNDLFLHDSALFRKEKPL